MKYHYAVRYLVQRRYYHPMRTYVRKHPKGICLYRRKSIQCIQMKPLALRYSSSTAGSMGRSKLPKITDTLKTSARVKDLVSIVWRLFQERKGTAIQAAQVTTIPVEGQNAANNDAKVAPLPTTEDAKGTVLASVQQDEIKAVDSVGIAAERREMGSGSPPKEIHSPSGENEEVRSDEEPDSQAKVLKAENSGLLIMAQRLPLYFASLSLPTWLGSTRSVPPKDVESKGLKSHSALSEASKDVEEVTEIVPKAEEPKQVVTKPPQFQKSVPKDAVDGRTRYLMRAVATATSLASRSIRLQEFCKHLCENPVAKALAVKERAIPLMLRLQIITPDPSIQAHINEALAMLGYVRPLPGHGIRILSIDGGGTRGLMAVEILRSLERISQQPIHQMFDFMCGVSTGAILTLLLGAFKAPMDECEELYRNLSTEIFKQSALWGTSNLVLSHAYYDTDTWVKVLKKNIGDMPLIETARDPTCPKIASLSTIVSETRLQNFIFRNYDYPHRHQSYFLGSYTPRLWEAVRASAAAPGYFSEYKLGNYVHQDGGVMTNNPTAVAIHESRHLWPNEKIQCVVSIGNGRYEPHVPLASKYDSSIKTKILRFVDSATDTEMVHTILGDLLPPNSYFRFNPYLTESVTLDETRPEKFKQLKDDVTMYLRKNEAKLQQAGEILLEPKTQLQRLRDTVKEKFVTYL